MSSAAYLFLEISTVALFGAMLWHAARRGTFALLELISAALYGVLLEWGNILIFETYSYSSGFWLAIGPVPIVIGLCWGLIIYAAMAYSDQLGIPRWAAPFADSLWAIVLDLAFDAIAIRLQLWTWTVPMTAGYFGVPADNFFAWLFVAVCFSAFTRWVRSRPRVLGAMFALQMFAPVAAFIGLLLSIRLFGVLNGLIYGAEVPAGGSLLIFALTMVLFAVLVGYAIWRSGLKIQRGIDLLPTLSRWAMHGYFFAWTLLLFFVPSLRLPGMDLPAALVWIALGLMIVEGVLLVPIWQRGKQLTDQMIVLPSREGQQQAKVERTDQIGRRVAS